MRETLPPTTELEENLRNGVYLAKLAHFMAPAALSYNKIYDHEQKRYATAGLQFRHTDNINHFLRSLKSMQLPLVRIRYVTIRTLLSPDIIPSNKENFSTDIPTGDNGHL